MSLIKMSKSLLYTLALLMYTKPTPVSSQNPDSLRVTSASMGKEIPCLVFTPQSHDPQVKQYPVLYLLHGYDGGWLSWEWLRADLQHWADHYRMYIVCPDAGNSWYLDSPVDPEIRYERFVAFELPKQIERIYPTIPHRSGRALAGISMGGHGAAFIALRHPDIFMGFASTSGGLDLRPFADEWNLKTILGPQSFSNPHWTEHSAVSQIEKWSGQDFKIYLDCGKADFFLQVNRDFHLALKERNIPHLYLENEGGHDADYWVRSMQYLMAFVYGMFYGEESSYSTHPWTDAP